MPSLQRPIARSSRFAIEQLAGMRLPFISGAIDASHPSAPSAKPSIPSSYPLNPLVPIPCFRDKLPIQNLENLKS